MAEPVDPAVLGVASALKSLRTRAGLREERLHGTELALDTLTGLDSVRALVNAGEPAARAIVRAVRAAAGTLEPTMSIVADASLGLELPPTRYWMPSSTAGTSGSDERPCCGTGTSSMNYVRRCRARYPRRARSGWRLRPKRSWRSR